MTDHDSYQAPAIEIAVPWMLAIVLRERRTIVAVAGIGAVIAILLAVLKTPLYTSTFWFIPQSEQSQGRDGLASIAGQFGLPLGAMSTPTQSPQLYADLLETREVLLPIARDSIALAGSKDEKVAVAALLGETGTESALVHERTIERLRRKAVSASVSRTTGGVIVRVQTPIPALSLFVADRLLDGVNRYNLTVRQSQAAAERRFTEARLREARGSLTAAENAFQGFLQANRRFDESSQLTFEKERRARLVSLHQQVVLRLAQENEDARIREVRDTPVITIIERPALPVLPDPLHRARNVIVLTLASVLFGVAWVLTREGWERQRQEDRLDPSYALLAQEWRRFVGVR